MKYAPRKVYIKESGTYVELSYTDFCRRKESDQRYMDKLFIPVQANQRIFELQRTNEQMGRLLSKIPPEALEELQRTGKTRPEER